MSFFSSIFNRKEQAGLHHNQNAPLQPEEEAANEDDLVTKDGEEHTLEEPMEDEGEYEVVEREILPNKIICPDCGGITLEGLEFCDKCGGELL